MSSRFLIRPALIEDAAAIARVHVDTWRAAYDGLILRNFLDALSVDTRTEEWRGVLLRQPGSVLVAVVEGSVVGWISFGPSRDAGDETSVEIYALYVRPEHWRNGVGRRLIEAMETQVGDAPSLTLWVLNGNARARGFYRDRGFEDDGHEKHGSVGGAPIVEARMRRTVSRR